MTLDTESLYFAPRSRSPITYGFFKIIRQIDTNTVEIRLLDERHKRFRSGLACITTLSHACVPIMTINECKIENMTELVKKVILEDLK